MEGLKIAIINNTEDENPSYVIRNKIVAKKLREKGHDVFCDTHTNDFDIDRYDIFIFNRFYEGSLLKYIEHLKSIGKTILYETDDNYEAIDENNPFMKIKDHAVLSSRELASLSDGIIVSTPEIKSEIAFFIDSLFSVSNDEKDVLRESIMKQINVIPNALNFDDYKYNNKKNKKLRVGFQGSNIHVQDLLIVVDAIKQLQEEIDFDFYIFGIDDRPFEDLNKFCLTRKDEDKWKWMDDFPKLYEKLQEINYIHVPTVNYKNYRDKLSELNFDIGIAPLMDTKFNRAKSCLKFYEYSAVGTVTLASNVMPYNQEMDKEDLVKNRHSKWLNKLRKLLTDEKYRQERLKCQMEWVFANRNLDKMVDVWEKTITKIYENNKTCNKKIGE